MAVLTHKTMAIIDTIKNDIKEAMKAKDQTKLTTLRGLQSAFVNELVAQKKTPQDPVDDELATTVIKRQVKQRKDAIEQFVQGGRDDLADNERAELAILENYMPQMMSKEDIMKIAQDQKDKLGVTDKSGMGQLMGAVMAQTQGQADGADVKAVVDELLS